MELVTVLSSSGKGTVTDEKGKYQISVSEKDSIWFSYLNKPTRKFPVSVISNPFGFDISLQVNVTVLKEVKVTPRNYKLDSIRNREEYAKIFDYRKPGLSTVSPSYGAAAGFDLVEIINAFRFRRNRNMLSFQRRLIAQEKDKFVSNRFSRGLVIRLTQMKDADRVDSFMQVFRPSYQFTLRANEYDFQLYIKESFERFQKGLSPIDAFTREDFFDIPQ